MTASLAEVTAIERGRKKKFLRDPDQWYTEPAWCSERLFAVEAFSGRIVDPCAGTGRIVAAARAAGLTAEGFDLRERGIPGVRGGYDFLDRFGAYIPGTFPCGGIVFNPPYGASPDKGGKRLEEAAIDRALERAHKVAAFLPTTFLNGERRSRWLETTPLYRVWLCSPRPSCPPGQMVLDGTAEGSGEIDYAWFVFLRGFQGPSTFGFLRRAA